jgi:hypothetical protein
MKELLLLQKRISQILVKLVGKRGVSHYEAKVVNDFHGY